MRIAALLVLSTALFCSSSKAAAPAALGVSSEELAKWERSLRRAGASSSEIRDFEDLLRQQSLADMQGIRDYIEHAPPNFYAMYLRGVRQEAREKAPKPLYPDVVPVRSCESMRDVSIRNAVVESASMDADDDSCRITVSMSHPPASDHVNVFIGLPVRGWNGRFRGTGGGGFLGGSASNLRNPVRNGYATGATDTGHEGGSGSFALAVNGRLNWQGIRDNAYLGIHDMTVAGKALTETFYGKGPKYAYFVGGSTGGRQGLMEAQRYPDDYNGIVSACPAINWHRMVPAAFWAQEVMLRSNNLVPKSKLDAATAAAVASCDRLDGVEDGVINDPDHCAYDPKQLVGIKVGDSMFTQADADVIRKIWEGPRGQDGRFLWYGLARGADLYAVAETTGTPLSGKPFSVSLEYIQYFLVQSPHWDWKTLAPGEFELLFNQSIEEFREVIGTDDPDLSRFRDRGGKILIYHGLADQLIPAQGTVDYYRQVQQRMGGPQRTANFARLFLVPGVDHGFVGAGPSPTGINEALITWVEQGKPPERILAELPDANGKTVRTRPLFPFPQIAQYKGSGSTDDAANFLSSEPDPAEH